MAGDQILRTNSRQKKSGIAEAYAGKSEAYFYGFRPDILAELPQKSGVRILEIGCGSGETGRVALQTGKADFYFGIEINDESASQASSKISEVLCANVEEIDISSVPDNFDVLIMSEVLEHLVDPWSTLLKVTSRMKNGSSVYASSPNLCHYRNVISLIKGKFEYTDLGVMDRTHLRWFTPDSFSQMFSDVGYKSTYVGPVTKMRAKAKLMDAIFLKKMTHLWFGQIMYRGVFTI